MIGTSNQAMETAAFEKQFDSRIKEFIVLTEGSPSAGKGGNAVLWNAYLKVLAVIDTGADALYNQKCSLTWLMTDEQAKSKDKLFGFEGRKIYRIKARESFAKGKNYLMVCGVTERNCTDDRLVHILEEYEKPVEISVSGCDKLVLNKELNLFEGNCSVNGSEFMLMLNVDDDNEDYSLSRQLWENLYANFCEWVDNARKFAAEMLIDTADDWLFSAYSDEHQDDDPDGEQYEGISKEKFADMITLISVAAAADGTFTFEFDDNDIFAGHTIAVEGSVEEGFVDAAF